MDRCRTLGAFAVSVRYIHVPVFESVSNQPLRRSGIADHLRHQWPCLPGGSGRFDARRLSQAAGECWITSACTRCADGSEWIQKAQAELLCLTPNSPNMGGIEWALLKLEHLHCSTSANTSESAIAQKLAFKITLESSIIRALYEWSQRSVVWTGHAGFTLPCRLNHLAPQRSRRNVPILPEALRQGSIVTAPWCDPNHRHEFRHNF